MPPTNAAVIGAITGLVVGDPHVAKTPPSSRTDLYEQELRDSFEQVGQLARAARASWLGCTADHTHRKNKTTHAEVIFAIDLYTSTIKAAGVPRFDSTIGNHDMTGNDVIDAPLRQPIGVLERAGAIHRADLEPSFYKDRDVGVVVAGLPYRDKLDPSDVVRIFNRAESHLASCKAGTLVILTHLNIEDPTLISSDKVALHQAVSSALGRHRLNLKNFDVVVANGHIHKPHRGITWDIDGTRVQLINVGALTRTSITEADNEIAAVCISKIGAAPAKCSLLPIACLPNEKAFIASPTKGQQDNGDLDTFVRLLSSKDETELFDPVSALESIAAAKKTPERILDRAREILLEVR